MERIPSVFKRLGKFLVRSSNTLLDTFFSDDADKRLAQKQLQEITDTLQHAAQEKSLVVLQITGDKKEIVSGWIVGKNVGKEQVMIKLQGEEYQVRIIALTDIIRVSILSPAGKNIRVGM